MKVFFLVSGIVVFLIFLIFIIGSYYMYRVACIRDKKFSTSVWENDELYNDFAKAYSKCGEDIVNNYT